MEAIKVFFDTNVLLKGFVASRMNNDMPLCLRDPTTKKYTFEKCIFEAYMAFRGIGGKKPDEGRGDWAQRFLRSENDPKPVSNLSSLFHGDDNESAFFWINQILELYGTDRLQHQKEYIEWLLSDDEKQAAFENISHLEQLVAERGKFEALCWDFVDFTKQMGIEEIPYITVFNGQSSNRTMPHPTCLDGFVRDTAFPSEDFEIAYAAISIRADMFITDDKKLIRCAYSLGLNYPLSAVSFCESKDYAQRICELRQMRE